MLLTIEKQQLENDVTVIQIGGRIALGRESRHIEPEVVQAIQGGARMVILDIAGVSHVDSTGIGIMAHCFGKVTQAGSQFRVSGARESVLSMFQITRLVHVVPFFPDLDSALQGNGRLV
jgi:anti-sigma B factor antagonist